MTLSDREILELSELCNRVVDGQLTESSRVHLNQWLARSEDARQFYIRAIDLSASLGHHASEMQMEAADLPRAGARGLQSPGWLWLTLAASVVAVGLIWAGAPAPPEPETAEFVAKITGLRDSVWSKQSPNSRLGEFVRRGEPLELVQGFAELTFDSGAVLVVAGPARIDVNSAWDATLHHGCVTARVPSQAIGFRISHPAVEVVDLGTEFSMVAQTQGAASVFVVEGEVEASPGSGADREAIVLRENESLSFSSVGDAGVENDPAIRPQSGVPKSFDRDSQPIRYLYWSFDHMVDRLFPAEAKGYSPKQAGMKWNRRQDPAEPPQGFRNQGVRFNGRATARALVPGISGDVARTVAFWVRVPEEAPLGDAYAMVAWEAGSAKLGARPVHIGWNRNPDEGPLGALRTDFSGGHAMGTTSLRDGRWHYVSIVFVPGVDLATPVQVKQYLDGQLESNRVTRGPRLSIAARGKQTIAANWSDTLWLGCRLGSGGPRKARFRGEVDELVVTDRSLDPSQIGRLMDGRPIDEALQGESRPGNGL
jgi:hypothetical protein